MLDRALAMEWVGVSGHLLGGSDLRCWRPFGVCGEGLFPPVHTGRVLG